LKKRYGKKKKKKKENKTKQKQALVFVIIFVSHLFRSINDPLFAIALQVQIIAFKNNEMK
jgi:hypothetical protein